MKRSKEVEYGDWSSLTPLEIAQEVLAWEDDRSALNRKYSQVLAKEVERLIIESRVEAHRHATIARDNANLRADLERQIRGTKVALDEVDRLKADAERLKAQVLTLQTEYVRQNPCVDPQDEIDELMREVEQLTAENTKLQADAKLGRMVRSIKSEGVLQHFKERAPKSFWIFEPDPRYPAKNTKGDIPEEALEKVGVTE